MASHILPPGVRVTPQRAAVVDAVKRTRGVFTAAGLHDEVRRAGRRVGLATVYRTLELLLAAGAVRRLRSASLEPVYVACRPEHHHHLVCTSCGAVDETDLCAAPPADELKRRYGFAAESHELDFYGTCARCSSR